MKRPGPGPEIRGQTSADLDELLASFDVGRILFQGSGLLALDKPAGLAVHASESGAFGVAEILAELSRLYPGLIEARAGKIHPAHLLDKEASGVLLFGWTTAMRRRVQGALAERHIDKRYVAVVAGPVEEAGEVRGRVRSKLRGRVRDLRSSASFTRIYGDDRLSLVEVIPREGRTHQIRALFAKAGRPLAGDLRYGKPKPSRQFLERFDVPTLLLHVLALRIPSGILGARRTIRAPLPQAFLRVIEAKGWPLEEITAKLESADQ